MSRAVQGTNLFRPILAGAYGTEKWMILATKERGTGAASRWATMALAALVLACAGCSALLPKLETPRLSLVSIKMQDMNFFEQRLLVRLRVQNPNDIALPVKGINVNFELAGEEFAEGVSARAFNVPAFGEAEFDMIVTADAATAILRIVGESRGKRVESLDYRIRGTLRTGLGLLGSVPFDEKGTIALDSLTRKDKGPGNDKGRADASGGERS
jgi:LEA14-like dessication related protein